MKRFTVGAALASVIVLALAVVAPHRAGAVVTSTWSVESYEQFDKGEAEAAFITSLGEVKPGWNTDRVDLEAPGVWAAVRAADGSVLLGTDKDGAVYRVRGKDVTKLVEIPDVVAIVSLAVSSDGTAYAGTMPGGKVWKISAAGKATELVALDGVETVWALALGTSDRRLYAGTGPDGKLFSIDTRSGKAEVAFETEDKRVLAVARASDGAVWLGTSEKALVFRFDPEGKKTRAMADFAGNEITAIAAIGGGVVVAANQLEDPVTSGVKTKEAVDKKLKKEKEGEKPDMPKEGTKPGADKATPSGAEPPRKGKRKGKGALFRVWGDGRTEQLHALTATYFTSLAVTRDGAIFAGAGDKGRIYLVDTDESVSTAFDVGERMVSHVLWSASGITFTTDDAAALYRTTGKASKAIYTSDVFDAEAPSRWGKIVYHGTTGLKIETRSGNTAEPGKGWSAWLAPKNRGRGGGSAHSGRIASPPGRYLQYRVSFNGDSDALLRKTRVYYLPQNKPTRITEVEVETGDAGGTKLVTLKSGAAKPRSPVVKVTWKVENPDKDKTAYTLEVRREGEVRWRPVALGDDAYTKTSFEWNTETFPDGYYRLRVTASDGQANSSDRAIESHKTTPLFLIDNEKPEIDGINVRYPRASARAADAMSNIAEMAYSIDDGQWHVGATRDGIFDELGEMLILEMPDDLRPGVHTLAIRVADEAGNIGSASVTFRVD